MGRRQTHHPGAGGPSGRYAGDRILKDDAIPRGDGQVVRGQQIDLRIGLGPLDHVTIDHHAKVIAEPRLVKDKLRIGRFGICGQAYGSRPVSFEKGSDACYEAPIKVPAHDLPVQRFLSRAVLEHFLRVQVAAEKIPDDLVVSLAEHPRCHRPIQPDAESFEVLTPNLFMDRIRIDDHTVQIENQSQSGSNTGTHIHRNRMIAQIGV